MTDSVKQPRPADSRSAGDCGDLSFCAAWLYLVVLAGHESGVVQLAYE